MPRAHRAHAEWTPSRLIRWAERTGPATGQLVAELLRRRPHPEQGYRTIQNILAAAQDRLPLAAPPRGDPDADARQHPRRHLLRATHPEEDRC